MLKNFKIVFEHHGDEMQALPVGISVVNPDGTEMSLLRKTGSTPSWSPDGKWIAFNDVPEGYEEYATNIFIMQPHGKNVKQLTFHKDSAAFRPRWNTDSNSIIYSLYTNQRYQIFKVCIDSCKNIQITNHGSYAYPEWDANGNIIALDKSNSPSSVITITENSKKIHSCDLFQPGDEEMVWSPSGKMIAFNRYGYLCIMNSDGTNLKEFKYGGPSKAGVLSISWVPDSSGVVFSAEIRSNPDINYNCARSAGKELFFFNLAYAREQPIVINPCFGKNPSSTKIKYAEIIDVSCSPFLASSHKKGLLSWVLRRNI